MFKKILNLFKPRNLSVAENADEMLKKFHEQHIANGVHSYYLTGKEFSDIISYLIDPDEVPVMDTGNWENANMQLAGFLIDQIKKHPSAWNKFRL